MPQTRGFNSLAEMLMSPAQDRNIFGGKVTFQGLADILHNKASKAKKEYDAKAVDPTRMGEITPEMIDQIAGTIPMGGLSGYIKNVKLDPKRWVGPYKGVNVGVNSPLSEIMDLKNQSKYGELRAFMDPEGNYYTWDSNDAIHNAIAEALNKGRVDLADKFYMLDRTLKGGLFDFIKKESNKRKIGGKPLPISRFKGGIFPNMDDYAAGEVWAKRDQSLSRHRVNKNVERYDLEE